tara:strand:- start:534 stop:1400 length:867 start_codon:yes stop_codon:yes gene_type:complete
MNIFNKDLTKNIYVNGCGGLGNILFQIASAIYYKEKFGGNIFLRNSNNIKYGTSNKFGRKQSLVINDNKIPYTDSIFKKFDLYDHEITEPYITIHNRYTAKKYDPEGKSLLFPSKPSCLCQNINLFLNYLEKIPSYLHFEDSQIKNYIRMKYPNIEYGTMIGIRVGRDFSHMKKITRQSYINALEKLKSMKINIDHIYIVSDVSEAWLTKFKLQDSYPATFVEENDIYQLYAGMMCKNFILSESTFHLWIAILSSINRKDKKVIYFNNTDLSNRPITPNTDNWIKIQP